MASVPGRTGPGAHLAAVFVEAFHLADHRFLPRVPPPEYSGGKTDYRSNFDGPTIGLSIDLAGDDCVKRADEQDRRAEPGPPGAHLVERGHVGQVGRSGVVNSSAARASRSAGSARPCSSLITRAAEESAASTPAPPYRQPNPHGKYGKHDVPRTGEMR